MMTKSHVAVMTKSQRAAHGVEAPVSAVSKQIRKQVLRCKPPSKDEGISAKKCLLATLHCIRPHEPEPRQQKPREVQQQGGEPSSAAGLELSILHDTVLNAEVGLLEQAGTSSMSSDRPSSPALVSNLEAHLSPISRRSSQPRSPPNAPLRPKAIAVRRDHSNRPRLELFGVIHAAALQGSLLAS